MNDQNDMSRVITIAIGFATPSDWKRNKELMFWKWKMYRENLR